MADGERTYEFNLPNAVPVRKVFDYIFKKLGGSCTQYGGSAMGEHIDGNTFLAILGEDGFKDDSSKVISLERLYHVDPHAGRFVNVGKEKTNHVTITPLEGRLLKDAEVEDIRKELAGLR